MEPLILALVVLLGLVSLVSLAALEVGTSTRSRMRRTFRCPKDRRVVTATFALDNFRPEAYEDVCTCSAFADPSRVTCNKACLSLPRAALAAESVEQR
jgi:hypothetical protein